MATIKIFNDFKRKFLRGELQKSFNVNFLPVNTDFIEALDENFYKLRTINDIETAYPDFDFNKLTNYAGDVYGVKCNKLTYKFTKDAEDESSDSYMIKPDFINSTNFDNFCIANEITDEKIIALLTELKTKGFYWVKSIEHYRWVANRVNADYNYNNAINIVLGDDIDNSNDTDVLAASMPTIGSANRPYLGTFEGLGHTIDSITIYVNGIAAGLIGKLGKTGVVRNLKITGNINIICNYTINIQHIKNSSADVVAAALVGINEGTISNIYVEATNITLANFKPAVYAVTNKTDSNNLFEINSTQKTEDCSNYFFPDWLCITSPFNVVPYVGYFNQGIPFSLQSTSAYNLYNADISKYSVGVYQTTRSRFDISMYGTTMQEADDTFVKTSDNSIFNVNHDVDDSFCAYFFDAFLNMPAKYMHASRAAYYVGLLAGLNNGDITSVYANNKITANTDTFVGFIGGICGKQNRGKLQNIASFLKFDDNYAVRAEHIAATYKSLTFNSIEDYYCNIDELTYNTSDNDSILGTIALYTSDNKVEPTSTTDDGKFLIAGDCLVTTADVTAADKISIITDNADIALLPIKLQDGTVATATDRVSTATTYNLYSANIANLSGCKFDSNFTFSATTDGSDIYSHVITGDVKDYVYSNFNSMVITSYAPNTAVNVYVKSQLSFDSNGNVTAINGNASPLITGANISGTFSAASANTTGSTLRYSTILNDKFVINTQDLNSTFCATVKNLRVAIDSTEVDTLVTANDIASTKLKLIANNYIDQISVATDVSTALDSIKSDLLITKAVITKNASNAQPAEVCPAITYSAYATHKPSCSTANYYADGDTTKDPVVITYLTNYNTATSPLTAMENYLSAQSVKYINADTRKNVTDITLNNFDVTEKSYSVYQYHTLSADKAYIKFFTNTTATDKYASSAFDISMSDTNILACSGLTNTAYNYVFDNMSGYQTAPILTEYVTFMQPSIYNVGAIAGMYTHNNDITVQNVSAKLISSGFNTALTTTYTSAVDIEEFNRFGAFAAKAEFQTCNISNYNNLQSTTFDNCVFEAYRLVAAYNSNNMSHAIFGEMNYLRLPMPSITLLEQLGDRSTTNYTGGLYTCDLPYDSHPFTISTFACTINSAVAKLNATAQQGLINATDLTACINFTNSFVSDNSAYCNSLNCINALNIITSGNDSETKFGTDNFFCKKGQYFKHYAKVLDTHSYMAGDYYLQTYSSSTDKHSADSIQLISPSVASATIGFIHDTSIDLTTTTNTAAKFNVSVSTADILPLASSYSSVYTDYNNGSTKDSYFSYRYDITVTSTDVPLQLDTKTTTVAYAHNDTSDSKAYVFTDDCHTEDTTIETPLYGNTLHIGKKYKPKYIRNQIVDSPTSSFESTGVSAENFGGILVVKDDNSLVSLIDIGDTTIDNSFWYLTFSGFDKSSSSTDYNQSAVLCVVNNK